MRVSDSRRGRHFRQLAIPNPNDPSALRVYDRQTMVGSIIRYDGAYYSYDAQGVLLGEYPTQGQAMRILPHVAARRRGRP